MVSCALGRQVTQELAERMLTRKQEEEMWYQKKSILDEAEHERRRLLLGEERKLAEQRKQSVLVCSRCKFKSGLSYLLVTILFPLLLPELKCD